MKRGRFGTAKKAALSADANDRGATEQIVAREPRERVCHDAFVIQRGHYRAAA